MYFVYAIHNKKHNRIYIGQTENLNERLKLHNRKEFKNSYTAQFDGEWSLVYEEKVKNRRDALKREKQLKSYRGREFVRSFIKN